MIIATSFDHKFNINTFFIKLALFIINSYFLYFFGEYYVQLMSQYIISSLNNQDFANITGVDPSAIGLGNINDSNCMFYECAIHYLIPVVNFNQVNLPRTQIIQANSEILKTTIIPLFHRHSPILLSQIDSTRINTAQYLNYTFPRYGVSHVDDLNSSRVMHEIIHRIFENHNIDRNPRRNITLKYFDSRILDAVERQWLRDFMSANSHVPKFARAYRQLNYTQQIIVDNNLLDLMKT